MADIFADAVLVGDEVVSLVVPEFVHADVLAVAVLAAVATFSSAEGVLLPVVFSAVALALVEFVIVSFAVNELAPAVSASSVPVGVTEVASYAANEVAPVDYFEFVENEVTVV